MTFKFNPFDMRELYVFDDGGWHVVPSAVEMPPDVSVAELFAAHKTLLRAWPDISPNAMLEALEAVRSAA